MLILANLSSEGIIVHEHGGVSIPSSVKMKTDYLVCSLDSADRYRIEYLREHWHYFNKHLFGGLLREPNFILSNKKKFLGIWYRISRRIEIGKQMFKQPVAHRVLGTLVHEMAHQYNDEVLHSTEKNPHGPSWQHIMASIGLITDAKYKGDLKTTDRIEQEEQHRRILDTNTQIDVFRFKSDKHVVMRFVSPSRGIDAPVVIEPVTQTPAKYLYGWIVRKDGTLDGRRQVFSASFVVVPGPLKSRTPLYREAQKRADELN